MKVKTYKKKNQNTNTIENVFIFSLLCIFFILFYYFYSLKNQQQVVKVFIYKILILY